MSKAAEILYTSQPTVSLQIKTLEEQLEVQLFERHGPKLIITTEGEILYNIVQPLVLGIDHVKDTFKSHYSDLSSGELTIAAEESTILYTLPGPIQAFVEQYPGIRLKIANVSGGDGYKMLTAEEADISISSLLTVPDDVEYHPFVSYAPVLITPRGHPLSKLKQVTLEDIGNYGLVLPSSQFSSWRMVKMVFALNGVNYKIVLETGGWEIVKRYVSIGLGISILTRICLTEDDQARFEIIPIDEYFPSRKYGSVVRKGKPLSAPATKFIEILHQQFQSPVVSVTATS